MDYELVHLIASAMLKNTEFFWQQYQNEVVIPDFKLIFFCSDVEQQDKCSYLHIDQRGDNPWMCVPVPFWDMLMVKGILNVDDDQDLTDPNTIESLVNKAEEIEDNLLAYVSCIISSVISLNKDKPFENDEDCDILNDKEQLKDFIENCEDVFVEDSEEDEEDEEDSQIASDTVHKDIIEIANSLGCSCTALEKAMIKYGFYEDGTYQVITATIPPEEYINSRKKAYFVNTGDIQPLFGKDWNSRLKNIKVDKDFNLLEK